MKKVQMHGEKKRGRAMGEKIIQNKISHTVIKSARESDALLIIN